MEHNYVSCDNVNSMDMNNLNIGLTVMTGYVEIGQIKCTSAECCFLYSLPVSHHPTDFMLLVYHKTNCMAIRSFITTL